MTARVVIDRAFLSRLRGNLPVPFDQAHTLDARELAETVLRTAGVPSLVVRDGAPGRPGDFETLSGLEMEEPR